MPKHDLSSRHFQRKISQFCEVRIAPISSKRVLENLRPYLISLIIYRKRPPILNGHLDWTAIGEACGVEDEMTVELRKQLRPALDAIMRWLKAPPVSEDAPPAKPYTRMSKTEAVKKTAQVSSTREPKRAAADGVFCPEHICATRSCAKADQPVSGSTIRSNRRSGELSGCAHLPYAPVR